MDGNSLGWQLSVGVIFMCGNWLGGNCHGWKLDGRQLSWVVIRWVEIVAAEI